MSQSVPRPDLRQLRIRAKELLREVRAGEAAAVARALPYFRVSDDFTLVSAQLVIAREAEFESWPKLRRELGDSSKEPGDPHEAFFSSLDAGDEDQVIELLQERPELAGVWRRDEYGWVSPLHVAARRGLLRVAEALVEAGAEIYAVNQGGYPPVFDAAKVHDNVAEFLMAASAVRDNGQPPTYGCGIDIVLAARLGLLDRVRMHVEKDPLAVYRRGCIGETVLHWPAHNGYAQVVRYLLDNGALIEADEIGLYGGKPLHWASEHSPNTVRLLLERGASPHSRNKMPGEFEGFTPLHMMASQREQSIEVARMLLEAGADPKALDAKGRTPFEVAKGRGLERSAEFLATV